MVCFKNGLFAQIKGRLRGLVFYTRAGRTYARSRPGTVHNPKTPLQQQQRNRMRDVVAFYTVVKQSPLLSAWQQAGREKGMTGMNYFVKLNISAFSGDGGVTDYRKLHFCSGSLPQGDLYNVVYKVSERTVDIHWNNETLLNEVRYTDRFMAVVLYENDGFIVFADVGEDYRRKDCHACIHLPEDIPPPLRVYCFFAAANGKAYSDDVCCRPVK